MMTGSVRKLLRTGEILTPRGADDGEVVWFVEQGLRPKAGKRASAGRWRGVDRRGGRFEIWAGTGATMEKGSAGVIQK